MTAVDPPGHPAALAANSLDDGPRGGDADASLRPATLAPRFRTLRTVTALMLREMGSTYGRSPGGYLWAILSPVGAIVVMSLAFSLLVRSPSLGTSFMLFYATGFLPFSFYLVMSQKIGMAVRYSRPLLAYPGVTWMDAVLARFFLNVLTEAMIFCIVMFGVFAIVDAHAVIDPMPIIVGLALAMLTGLGVGLINCLLIGYAPVWDQVWSIINRPLFIASGIFFIYEDMPPLVQNILWWNPVLHATAWVRTGFYPSYHASFVSLTYGFGVALVMIALGMVLLRQGYRAGLQR